MDDQKTKAEKDRASWQYRAVEATRGPETKLGAILLAVLDKQRRTIPQFRGKATITSDGFVMCNFLAKDGGLRLGAFVCDVDDLVRNFRGLADHLKLSDAERKEMFQAVRNWIGTDYRSNKDLGFPG
jgi:hypothetical protein